MKIDIYKLRALLSSKFQSHGYPEDISNSMSGALITSELFGKTTHGLVRYNWILNKKVSNKIFSQDLSFDNTINIIDATELNGYFVAQKVVEKTVQDDKHDFNITVLKNIFPTNVLIDYLEQFHKHQKGAIICTTTPRLVGVRKSGKKILGTNPIGYTFPNDREIILGDFSTSHLPLGKILENINSSESPRETVLNDEGNEVFAKDAIDNKGNLLGALLPLGGEQSEHKGFSISLLVELLTTMLAGERSENGDMIICSFSRKSSFYSQGGINDLFYKLKDIEPSLRLPGQKSYDFYKNNLEKGYIELGDTTLLDTLSLTLDEILTLQYHE